MDQWLKLQQRKRKQEPVHATASTASTETDTPDARVDTNEGDDAHKQRKIVRRYDDSYLSFGFTWCGDINEPKPQCVICSEKLSNHSMKPLLQRHFNTKHLLFKDKPIEFFKRKKMEMQQNKKSLKSFTAVSSQALEASYLWSVYELLKQVNRIRLARV